MKKILFCLIFLLSNVFLYAQKVLPKEDSDSIDYYLYNYHIDTVVSYELENKVFKKGFKYEGYLYKKIIQRINELLDCEYREDEIKYLCAQRVKKNIEYYNEIVENIIGVDTTRYNHVFDSVVEINRELIQKDFLSVKIPDTRIIALSGWIGDSSFIQRLVRIANTGNQAAKIALARYGIEPYLKDEIEVLRKENLRMDNYVVLGNRLTLAVYIGNSDIVDLLVSFLQKKTYSTDYFSLGSQDDIDCRFFIINSLSVLIPKFRDFYLELFRTKKDYSTKEIDYLIKESIKWFNSNKVNYKIDNKNAIKAFNYIYPFNNPLYQDYYN